MFVDPFNAHGRLPTDPGGQPDFPLIPFAGLAPGRRIPPKAMPLLPPFRPIVGGVQRAGRRCQQFLSKLLDAQTPASLYRFKLPGQVRPPPLFR